LTGFLGSYLHQLDEKGRVALPAAFRRSVADEGFVLIHGFEPALFLYPQQAWAVVENELGELMRRQPEARGSVLSLTAKAVEVVPDKQGRILIPERLQRAAKLEGTALIVGVLDKIEIWNPELFEGTTEEGKPGIEQFVRQIIV
jgi:MraZ protein